MSSQIRNRYVAFTRKKTGVEGNRLEMREREPHQARRRRSRVAHEMVVISPDNCDEKVAHGVAQPCRPEQQERLVGG